MLEVRKFDYFEDDRDKVQCVRCGSSADVVIDAGLAKLDLCEERFDLTTAEMVGLQGELKRGCLYCRHWQCPNDNCKRHDGRCLLHEKDADYLKPCESFEPREAV